MDHLDLLESQIIHISEAPAERNLQEDLVVVLLVVDKLLVVGLVVA